jgi:hypothetical protein
MLKWPPNTGSSHIYQTREFPSELIVDKVRMFETKIKRRLHR